MQGGVFSMARFWGPATSLHIESQSILSTGLIIIITHPLPFPVFLKSLGAGRGRGGGRKDMLPQA